VVSPFPSSSSSTGSTSFRPAPIGAGVVVGLSVGNIVGVSVVGLFVISIVGPDVGLASETIGIVGAVVGEWLGVVLG
jgi:hypothetical protein